jgi:hypothetical protein
MVPAQLCWFSEALEVEDDTGCSPGICRGIHSPHLVNVEGQTEYTSQHNFYSIRKTWIILPLFLHPLCMLGLTEYMSQHDVCPSLMQTSALSSPAR